MYGRLKANCVPAASVSKSMFALVFLNTTVPDRHRRVLLTSISKRQKKRSMVLRREKTAPRCFCVLFNSNTFCMPTVSLAHPGSGSRCPPPPLVLVSRHVKTGGLLLLCYLPTHLLSHLVAQPRNHAAIYAERSQKKTA